MPNRRFTRLTNAFSKKVANLVRSIAITFMHEPLPRAPDGSRTPTMAAGIAGRVWDRRAGGAHAEGGREAVGEREEGPPPAERLGRVARGLARAVGGRWGGFTRRGR